MRWEPGEACSPAFTALRVPAVRAQSLSRVRLFVTPWAEAHQAPVSMGFSRQEYWSELPRPPPGDLPDPGIEPASLVSPALAGVTSPPLVPSGKPGSQGVFEEITSSLSLCLSVLTCAMGVKPPPPSASSISGCGVPTETEGVKFVQQGEYSCISL